MPVERKHKQSEAIANFDYWITDAQQQDEYEEMIFFYHKDHLGSSTQISDPGANIIQHIEYLPYGELFFERRDYWNTPYKFNAKELDEETGMYYYGARYYTPEVSVWLSVDRFADKYPHLSPYHYCAGNPINLIDINGDSIRISFGGFLGIGKKNATYIDGKFYDKNGGEIESDNKFYQAVNESLDKLNSEEQGKQMVEELATSPHDFVIKRAYGEYSFGLFSPHNDNNTKEGVGSGGIIYLSLRQEDPMFVVIAHEMGHAISSNRGITNLTEWGHVGRYSFSYDEQIAMHYENKIRGEHNLPLRRFYHAQSQAGKAVQGIDGSVYRQGYHYYGGHAKMPSWIKQYIIK